MIQKTLLNCGLTDPNKILPIKYEWARKHYKDGVANNWTPEEIPMQLDVELWKKPNGLTDDERRMVLWNLGFFSTAESLTANNLVLAVYKHITNPECRQYLLRQAFEEALHCYIEGTEILTQQGFKDFRSLTPDDLVAQYEEGGNISFVKPHTYYADHFEGELIRFSNESRTYEKLVTPDHRCVTLNERKNNELEITLAKDISPSNRRFPVAGTLCQEHGRTKLSLWERLYIAYQADGSLLNKGQDNGSRCGFVSWSFNLKKQRKKDRLLWLISELDLKYKEYLLPEKHGKVDHSNFRIWVPVEKRVPKDFSWIHLNEITSSWIEEFIEEISYWDGCRRDNGAVVYTTTNKSCMEKVQTLAHLCGRRAGLYRYQTSGWSEGWQLHIHSRSFVSGKTIYKEEVPYSGMVYCVGVPSGMLVVRYNERVVISGNTDVFIYCCDSLGLNPDEVYTMYQTIPSIKAKDDFVIEITRSILDPNFATDTPQGVQDLVHDLVGYYVIMEGIFFYAGFAMMLSLLRNQKMVGVGEQFQLILKDESVHLAFGADLINQIVAENPAIWTDAFKAKITANIQKAVELEHTYAEDCLPRGILGLNARLIRQYLEYIADRRLERIGLPRAYNATNPFPWMSEIIDLRKEKNFFETRVTEYQTSGSLDW